MRDFWVLLSAVTLFFTGAGCLAAEDPPASVLPNLNKLTDQEKADGWQLLFDGKTSDGWRKYKQKAIARLEGHRRRALPREQFGRRHRLRQAIRELHPGTRLQSARPCQQRDHVAGQRRPGTTWATGIEYQLLDNTDPHGDSEKAGWAYALYKPADDPKTGKPLDATNPIGHWNHVKIVYDGNHVEHWMNGVKYCEFELGSDDFNQRVQQSKFRTMPGFAKNKAGLIALQGDHGNVSFANIKIKVLPAK